MRPLPRLLLYAMAWIITSLVITETTISLRGDFQPFSTPTARNPEEPGSFAANAVTMEAFFGLLNGGLYLLLLWALLKRLPRDRSIILPSAMIGLLLGLVCAGGWNGFLYALTEHSGHTSVGQKIAVGVLPYLVSGAVAGCLRLRPQL